MSLTEAELKLIKIISWIEYDTAGKEIDALSETEQVNKLNEILDRIYRLTINPNYKFVEFFTNKYINDQARSLRQPTMLLISNEHQDDISLDAANIGMEIFKTFFMCVLVDWKDGFENLASAFSQLLQEIAIMEKFPKEAKRFTKDDVKEIMVLLLNKAKLDPSFVETYNKIIKPLKAKFVAYN